MRFSVIIPVYNVELYLAECLDSILKQDLVDWECLCIDDGSPDRSGTILDDYARRDSRFRIFHRTNMGVSASRNYGLSLANGEYIVFVDSDDVLVPWALTSIDLALRELRNADIVTYGIQCVKNMAEEPPLRSEFPAVCKVMNGSDSEIVPAFHRVVGGLLAWNGCYRRSLIGETRFLPFPNGEDMLFGATCFCKARSIVHIKDSLYRYRVSREGSAVNVKSLRHLKSVCDVSRELCSVIVAWRYASLIRSVYSRKLLVQIVGVAYDVLMALPKENIQEGKKYYLDSCQQIARSYPQFLSWFDRLVVRVAVATNSLVPVTIALRIPLNFRVRLLSYSCVRRLKALLRHEGGF